MSDLLVFVNLLRSDSGCAECSDERPLPLRPSNLRDERVAVDSLCAPGNWARCLLLLKFEVDLPNSGWYDGWIGCKLRYNPVQTGLGWNCRGCASENESPGK